ncbi:MAG: ribbon-helix-helix protein, CopG family [Chloroflexi bacterium]|nr:ribbon-helix-helix protein, CopG family [Chloroflexota bacterium]
MKVKTSITLSEATLRVVDRQAHRARTSRSDLIETAVRAYLVQLARAEQNAKDLAILNQHADRLNAEAEEVLAFQASV